MQKKRSNQKQAEDIHLEKTTNPLRKIAWYHLIFAGWGGSTTFIILQAIFGFHILGMR